MTFVRRLKEKLQESWRKLKGAMPWRRKSVERWHPAPLAGAVARPMGPCWGDPWGFGLIASRWWPPLEVAHAETEYVIRVEVAGLRGKELRVAVRDGSLVLRG